jgi:CxxC motif-containing protein
VRILTSAVLAEGLPLRMVPVRTDRAVPKEKLFEAMAEIKKFRLKKTVRVGEVVIPDIAGTGADLIATREVD